MAKKRRHRVTPDPSRGHVTAPSRSLDDRHVLRDVMAADTVFKSKPKKSKPDFRPVEDLRHVPDQIDKREVFRLRDGRHASQVRRPERQGKRSLPGELSTPMHDYFVDPKRALVCIRRHDRRRVLFALQRVGKGRRVSRERQYTDKSYVRCK